MDDLGGPPLFLETPIWPKVGRETSLGSFFFHQGIFFDANEISPKEKGPNSPTKNCKIRFVGMFSVGCAVVTLSVMAHHPP